MSELSNIKEPPDGGSDQHFVRQFRRLKMGEIVLATDEIYDDHKREWVEPEWSIGKPAPDPAYTSHRQFRRRINSQENDQGSADQSRRMKTSNRKEPATAGFGRAASACSACGGCGMLPGIKPDDDVMNTPCPQCNPWAKAKTSTHEPAIAVHDVFSEAIPGAFGLPFLRRLLNKPNS